MDTACTSAVWVPPPDRAGRAGCPERVEQFAQRVFVDVAGERPIETLTTLEYGFGSRESGFGEQRGGDTGMRRPARVQTLCPRAVRQVLDDPARLAAGDSECAHDGVFIE